MGKSLNLWKCGHVEEGKCKMWKCGKGKEWKWERAKVWKSENMKVWRGEITKVWKGNMWKYENYLAFYFKVSSWFWLFTYVITPKYMESQDYLPLWTVNKDYLLKGFFSRNLFKTN